MWLLKLHFSISVLCLLTFLGFRMVYKEQVKENGYVPDEKKKKGLSFYFICPDSEYSFCVCTFNDDCNEKRRFRKEV